MLSWMVAVLFACAVGAGAQNAPGAETQRATGPQHVTAEQFAQKQPGAKMVDREHYSIALSKRNSPAQSELHENETDIFYIVNGSATLVIGGTLEGGKSTAAGEIRGSGIKGGQTVRLARGDSMVIPKRTPHWMSAVDGSIEYFVVKIKE